MRKREFWLLVGPSMLVMVGLLVVPLYRTIQWSFQEVQYGAPGVFVGLQNYTAALTDPRFGRAVLFTVVLTLVVTAILLVLGYIIATLINQIGKLRPVVLGILLVSYVLPAVVGSAAFSWLFDTNFGGVANLLVHQADGGRDPLVHRRLAEPGDDHPVHHLAPAAVQHADHPGRAAGRARRDHRGRRDRRGHLAQVAPATSSCRPSAGCCSSSP